MEIIPIITSLAASAPSSVQDTVRGKVVESTSVQDSIGVESLELHSATEEEALEEDQEELYELYAPHSECLISAGGYHVFRCAKDNHHDPS